MKFYRDLSGQPHDVKLSPHGKGRLVPTLGTRLGGQLTSFERFGEQKKNTWSHGKSNPNSLVYQPQD
jgi:hypothetical protein